MTFAAPREAAGAGQRVHFSTDRYLDRRYGPDYRCWHLVRDAWLDLTGVDLGDPHRAMEDHRLFVRLPRPRSPSIVLLRRPGLEPHAGLFYRGRMLHIGPRGVSYEHLATAAFGFSDVRFYECRASR